MTDNTPAKDPTTAPEGDLAAVERLGAAYRRIVDELGKVIVGQHSVVEELLVAMLAGGHALLVGVPGLAKTLMVRTLAETLTLSFNRIQFTPDLMPADITGTEVIQEDKTTGARQFKFLPGPIFCNVLLADEINRTPPKTQAALLEAMQEHQVTAGGERHQLPAPFFVLATQNPIEQEGTYPLPEAQLDRFMFEIQVNYPTEEEEFQIVRQTTVNVATRVQKVLGYDEWTKLQELVRRVPVADSVIRYAMQFARLTRKQGDSIVNSPVPDFVQKFVSWGAGPRASQYLILGAKARAILHGRPYASTDDVRSVAAPVLRHRILTNFNAEAEGVTSDDIVRKLTEIIPPEGNVSPLVSPFFKTAHDR
ncbi:MAG: MoxR family ATPase [Planctomycetes bacterium]|nr:MoxR family ATPase [Planctomycetota bacterium]